MRLVSVVGLKATDTWQFPLAEIDDPHKFVTTSNGRGALIDEISRGSMFGLVIVTVLMAEAAPTCTRPNPNAAGENVGLARIPVPSRVTDWGLFAASSIILRFPLRAPVWVGLNSVSMVQVAAGARSWPLHPSLARVNSPDGTTLVISRVAPVGFLTVVVLDALIAPASTWPKFVFNGVIVSLPAIPTPLSAAEPALAFAVSLTASDAVRVPSAAGVKANITVQLVPLARVDEQPLLLIANSLAFAPVIWILKPVTGWPMAGLIILTLLRLLVAPVTPKTTLPNAKLAGETVSPAAAAGGAAAAIIPSTTTRTSARKFRL